MRHLWGTALMTCLLCLTALCGRALAEYPEKPVTVIVPFAAGGGTDTQARMMLKYVEGVLKTPFVIVNRAGAGGEIGMAQVSKASPDGYTLGVIAYPDSFIRTGYMDTTYKNDDYIYIGTAGESPVACTAGPKAPFGDVESLVKHGKSIKGAVTVGVASDAHYLAAKIFADLAGINIAPVFFKSGAAAVNALLGGHIDMQCSNVQFAMVGAASGAKVLAVAAAERTDTMPEAKTFKEQGYDVELAQSRVLVAPKGTDKAVIARLQKAMQESLPNNAELAGLMKKTGESYKPVVGADAEQKIRGVEKALEGHVKKYAKELVAGQQ